jgi:hypothetical protein
MVQWQASSAYLKLHPVGKGIFGTHHQVPDRKQRDDAIEAGVADAVR